MSVVEKAILNTLLGMGTVFIILIFISFIISLFGIISKLQNKTANKKAESVSKTVEAAPVVAAPVVEEEEEIDDLALIAVIAAAIAASEGVSPDGLVVRSIRRSRKNWKNA